MVEAKEPEFRLEDLTLTTIPGYTFEAVCDSAHEDRLVMGVQQSGLKPLSQNVFEVLLQTNKGINQAILTVSQRQPGVVMWIPGGYENFNGPAGGLYADLVGELQAAGMSSLRMGLRQESSFEECVLDALSWLCFLKGAGAKEVVLVGNTRGAAVAIATAALHPQVKAIAAISPQQDDTDMVDRIGQKPLLVIHGERDNRIPVEVAHDLYSRANEPKELVIYPRGSFSLIESRDELSQKLGGWVSEQLGISDAYIAALKAKSDDCPDLARSVPSPEGGPARQMLLTRNDIVDMDVEAIVSTTGTWLDMKTTSLARSIAERGGWEIQDQLWAQAPLFVGDVGVTGAGQLKAKHIFHAITGGESADEPLSRDEAVALTTRGALKEANDQGLKTIALPAIGTGGRGFPIEKAAQIMVGAITDHLLGETSLEQVIIGVVSDGVYRAFESQFNFLPES